MPLTWELQPVAPTTSLPALARLSSIPTEQIERALANLRNIYTSFPLPPPSARRKHVASVPDSGYASAEEDEEGGCEDTGETGIGEGFDVDVLRSDPFEREFVIRWLTAFTARSDSWVCDSGIEEEKARTQLVDDAAFLLASFAGSEDEEDALTRTFSFPTFDEQGIASGDVHVELNDAPLLSQDHTSVGLQSWGSSIVFAERMCAHPSHFGLTSQHDLRLLELGAGTGMLSIAVAKLCAQKSASVEVVATDYHPQVLDNLRSNVEVNFTASRCSPITVAPLDWQTPIYNEPLHRPFDVILAADVIYHPDHARWIKACVETLLQRPMPQRGGGVFWLIIPVRSTGRHEGMADTVEAVFRSEAVIKAAGGGVELGILVMEGVGKHDGIGRADESCYRLFKIGWVEP